jgi:hypothetical protein
LRSKTLPWESSKFTPEKTLSMPWWPRMMLKASSIPCIRQMAALIAYSSWIRRLIHLKMQWV